MCHTSPYTVPKSTSVRIIMDARVELEKRIEFELQKLTELQGQLWKTEAFIQGLQTALKLLPKEATAISTRNQGMIRAGSDVQKAKELLEREGLALHISQILVGIGKDNTKRNRASLSGSLARYARKDQMFVRTGPNEFGVTEHTHSTNGANQQVDLPPMFGGEGNH